MMMEGDHPGMIQRCKKLHFPDERLWAGLLVPEDYYCDQVIDQNIPGEKHLAEAADAQHPDDLV